MSTIVEGAAYLRKVGPRSKVCSKGPTYRLSAAEHQVAVSRGNSVLGSIAAS